MVARLKKIEGSWPVKIGKYDVIAFTVSKSIKIRGISLHRAHPSGITKTFTGNIGLYEATDFRTLYEESFEISMDDQPSYVDRLFSSPQEIEKDTEYIIAVGYTINLDQIWASVDAENPAVAVCGGDEVTFNFSKSKWDSNGSDESKGQIPRILFSC